MMNFFDDELLATLPPSDREVECYQNTSLSIFQKNSTHNINFEHRSLKFTSKDPERLLIFKSSKKKSLYLDSPQSPIARSRTHGLLKIHFMSFCFLPSQKINRRCRTLSFSTRLFQGIRTQKKIFSYFSYVWSLRAVPIEMFGIASKLKLEVLLS